MKKEFSKKLLGLDYLIFVALIIAMVLFPHVDFVTIVVSWIAQLGISSAAYYWKAKNENRMKVPMNVVSSLPEDVREQVDLTQVMVAIIQSE